MSIAAALADAGNGGDLLDRRAQHRAQRAEAGQQGLGHRLDVAAREGAEQVELQQLVVGQGDEAADLGALTQAFAMAQVMGVGRLTGRRAG
jgi:hypothetical protein